MLSLRAPTVGHPLVIGHRGASGEAPENTLAAFRRAVDQGSDLIELDVQLSADGHPVVIHDPTLDRTTDGRGPVAALTLSEIRRLDAGSHFGPSWGEERVRSLDEVLEWASAVVAVAIEIKHDGPFYDSRIEAAVVDALLHNRMVESAAVISFDHAAVQRVKRLCPELASGVLFACSPIDPASLALHAGADALLPHLGSLSAEMVDLAHARGLAVCPWVADEEPEMRWALSLGVDAIATNYPGRLARLLQA